MPDTNDNAGLTFDAPVQQDTHINPQSTPLPSKGSGVQSSDSGGLTFDAPVQQDTHSTDLTAPTNNVGDFIHGAYETAVKPIVNAVLHPIDTASQLVPNLVSSEGRMIDNAKKVDSDPHSTFGQQFDAGLYLIPGVGEQLKTMDDLAKNGQDQRAYGQAAGLLASILGPKVAEATSGPMLAKLASRTSEISPNVSRLVNNSIGLKASDLSGWEKVRPGSAHEIGATVFDQTGFKNSAPKQYAAIEDAITRNQTATADIVNKASASGATYDVHHTLLDQAVQLHDQLEQSGVDASKLKAVDTNLKALESTFAKSMIPTEMIEARNKIGKTITDWNPNTQDVGQRYRQMVYHDLNNKTQTLLPSEEADAFRANNRIINRLLIAKDAAGRSIVSGELKPSSAVGKVAGVVRNAAIGAAEGGRTFGHTGAAVGAAVGAATSPAVAPYVAQASDFIRRSAPNLVRQAGRGGVKAATNPTAQDLARGVDLTQSGNSE
jgi:hypothetical protein